MKKTQVVDIIYLLIATLFGVGYTPLCPGTASCVVALIIFLLIANPIYFLIFTIISVIIAFLVSSRAEKIYGVKDCKRIVIDDFSGMLIAFLFIPRQFVWVIAAFFLFRMLDMLKIPPADRVEKFSGAKGIVGDDLVAGIYANLILQVARVLVNIFS
jgi:phosphatidylglycerophosphatase A